MEAKAKPIYKKVWFWVLIFFVIGGIGALTDDDKPESKAPEVVNKEEKPKEEPKKEEPVKEEPKKEEPVKEEPVKEEPKEPEVSREFKNALSKAKTYADMLNMSELSIFDQLVSEYGENFPEDAAQYAIDNLDVDYNYNALQKAISYQDLMSMSHESIRDQLTSEYGEQFTEAQADYAMENLPE